MVMGQLILVLIVSTFGPGLPAWMVESAPTESRYTIVGVGYNLAQALLGGTAPLLATAAYGVGGSVIWTGVYFGSVGLLSMICLCCDARRQAHGQRGYTVQLNDYGMSDGESGGEENGGAEPEPAAADAAGGGGKVAAGGGAQKALPPRP